MRRLGLIAALLLSTVTTPTVALAGVGTGDQGGGIVNGAIWAGVQFSTPPSSSGGGDGNGCRWTLARPYDSGIGTDNGPVTRELNGITYVLYERSCSGSSVYIWIPQPGPSQLGQQAANTIISRLPAPAPQTAPPPAAGVVNVGMWFWTDRSRWAAQSVTAWVPTPSGVLWARTTATPTRLVYSSGAPEIPTVACAGPGRAWVQAFGDEMWTSCMSMYGRAGTYAAAMGIEWSITFTSSNGVTGSLGTHTTWAPLAVSVEEVQALVTS